MSEPTVTQMILEQLKHQGETLDELSTDVAVIKEKVSKLEDQAKRSHIHLDWKALTKIVGIVGVIVVAAIRGAPEAAWTILIKALGGG